jgi:hypothetical protein
MNIETDTMNMESRTEFIYYKKKKKINPNSEIIEQRN